MLAIGIDAEDISRFIDWSNYSIKSLSRIFTQKELAYCLAIPSKSAERFAVRWAAKEACYKALNIFFTKPISYSLFCKQVEILSEGKPTLIIDWDMLSIQGEVRKSSTYISLTHTKTTAIAVVIFN